MSDTSEKPLDSPCQIDPERAIQFTELVRTSTF
jgi:hypothetical protein